jgi:hypothetical protein
VRARLEQQRAWRAAALVVGAGKSAAMVVTRRQLLLLNLSVSHDKSHVQPLPLEAMVAAWRCGTRSRSTGRSQTRWSKACEGRSLVADRICSAWSIQSPRRGTTTRYRAPPP